LDQRALMIRGYDQRGLIGSTGVDDWINKRWW